MVLLRGCHILHNAVFVYALFAAAGICWSADYPNKPVRLLVGFPAGGAADITARAIGQRLTNAFGQQVVVMSGAEIVHVPYKGGGIAMLDLISGQVQINFSTLATSIPQIKAGRIRGLAVTTAGRAILVPELPTIAEAGLPGYEANN